MKPPHLKAAAPKPWGIIATALWALLAMLISFVVSLVALTLWTGGAIDRLQNIMSNGPLLSLMILLSAVVQILVLASVARRRGRQAADYLGWIVPRGRDAAEAFAAVVAFLLVADAITYLLHRDTITSFQDAYRSARQESGLVLLWIAVVIAAPISEEIMFRGFLYRGWARSPRAVLPAVVITSTLWALSHVQYDWFGMLQIFLLGLILGWARWRSGSTMLTFGMHASTNTWAMVETTVQVDWFT
jgi:membrane protease YdiL (CAAX protease family)